MFLLCHIGLYFEKENTIAWIPCMERYSYYADTFGLQVWSCSVITLHRLVPLPVVVCVLLCEHHLPITHSISIMASPTFHSLCELNCRCLAYKIRKPLHNAPRAVRLIGRVIVIGGHVSPSTVDLGLNWYQLPHSCTRWAPRFRGGQLLLGQKRGMCNFKLRTWGGSSLWVLFVFTLFREIYGIHCIDS